MPGIQGFVLESSLQETDLGMTTVMGVVQVKGISELLVLRYRMRPPVFQSPAISSTGQLTRIHVLIAFLCMAGCASAACAGSECSPPEGWDNFANNLGSDLAPLLALFGEQVTKQYMSESLSWVDSLLFSLAPLGIITAMVAAVRVGGSPMLRSLVGRVKETRGEVEADLMSSTSPDVCELWNGEGVVRVLGHPVLLQLIYQESKKSQDNCGLDTFQEAAKIGLYRKKGNGSSGSDIEGFRQEPPNLSLNVSMRPPPKCVLVLFITAGIILQGGVLVYAAISQYILKLKKNDGHPVRYGFPLFLVGTFALSVGMFLCAQVVNWSTVETTWEPTSDENAVIWLQQGGQTVGDQRFESFARKTPRNDIITSHKSKKTNQFALVTTSVSITMLGFVAQFVALRAMHSSVTAAQLGAILAMTAIRSCAHIQRESKNDIANPDQVEGHELDWLAKYLNDCKAWEVISGLAVAEDSGGVSGGPVNVAMEVMKTRARLAGLSEDWNLEDRVQVRVLQNVIEETMNDVYSSMTVKDEWKNAEELKWTLSAKAQRNDGSWQQSEVDLTIIRGRDQNNNWKPWQAKEGELEAVFCLWTSSLIEANRAQAGEGPKNARCIGLASFDVTMNHRIWIYRRTTLETSYLSPDIRYFGRIDVPEDAPASDQRKYLCIGTGLDLRRLCAQELYAAFMFKLASIIKDVGGTTKRRIIDSTGGENDCWMKCGLINTNVDLVAKIFHESRLGTIEEAYFIIIPVLHAAGKVPPPHEACDQVRNVSSRLEFEGRWAEAFEIDRWLYSSIESTWLGESGVKASIAKRSWRLTAKLVKMPANEKSAELWRLAYSECRVKDLSPFRAVGLMNLCTSLKRFQLEVDLDTVFQVTFDAVKALGVRQECALDVLMVFARLALQEEKEEAEDLARLVWDNTIPSCDDLSRRRGYEAAQILRIVRQRKGMFMRTDELQLYLKNPGLKQRTLIGKDDRHPVPLDLLLIRNWRTPLQAAAGAGRLEIVKQLLDTKADINAKPEKGMKRTALQEAAEAGNYLAKTLLAASKNTKLGSVEYSGRTTLQAAAEAGHLDIVELLLKEKAEVNAEPAEGSGRTALQAAAEAGHLDIVELLLKEKAEVNAKPAEDSGRTALQAAAEAGHLDIVGLLLKEKAEVNAEPVEDSGRTALQAAAEAGHLDIVKLLLKEKAEVNAEPAEGSGRTALQAAAEAGHLDIVELLLKEKAEVNAEPAEYSGRTALQAAAEAGHLDIVKLLLKEKAEVNAEPAKYSGRTALQAAAEAGHLDIVKLLLKEKAEVNAKPAYHSGRTALQAAAEVGHLDIVELLLKEKAEVNAEPAEYSGRTVLQAAAEAGHLEIVELLLKEKAEVNAKPVEDSGRTALQAAAEVGHLDIVELLLKEKAEVNAKPAEDSGRTALQAAAEAGHLEIVELLLKEKAEVNAKPARYSGRTALQAAAERGHVAIVEVLLDAGADTHTHTTGLYGETARDLAKRADHHNIVRLLDAAMQPPVEQ